MPDQNLPVPANSGNNQLFDFNGQPVRLVLDDNSEPHFVASDVCRVLEISDVKQAIERLDPDERGKYNVLTGGGIQQTTCISESGLYALVLTSRKPEAKAFKRWITHEVLPQIRKTGGYSVENMSPAEIILMQAQRLVDQERRVKALEQEQAEQGTRIERLEANTGGSDYFTVIGYCRYRGLKAPSLNEAISLGKRATALSVKNGQSVGKTMDQRFGEVHTYHVSILDELMKAVK